MTINKPLMRGKAGATDLLVIYISSLAVVSGVRLALAMIITTALTTAVTAHAQQGTTRIAMPAPGFMPNPARGAGLYAEKCARCHGKSLDGTGKGPPLLHPFYRPDHHGDPAFYSAVQNGSRQHHWKFGDMPPVSGLSPEDAGHIVAYVRREQRRTSLIP